MKAEKLQELKKVLNTINFYEGEFDTMVTIGKIAEGEMKKLCTSNSEQVTIGYYDEGFSVLDITKITNFGYDEMLKCDFDNISEIEIKDYSTVGSDSPLSYDVDLKLFGDCEIVVQMYFHQI